MAIDTEPVAISPDAVPERVLPLLDASKTPAERRMIVARAALPMPPEQLVPCLAWLSRDLDQDVRRQARTSLESLPAGTLDNLLAMQDVDAGVLDALGRTLKDTRLLGRVVVNRSTPDQTLNHLARTTDKVVLLEIIGRNQDRIEKQPDLVEALYFNSNTPMRIAQAVFEFAVRQGLPIQHIPGYQGIVEGLLGKDFKAAPVAAPKAEPIQEEVFEEETTTPETETPTEGELDEFGRALEDFEGFEEDEEDDKEDLSDFDLLLRAAAETGDEASDEEKDGPMGKSLNAELDALDVPERIRMALVGNSNARTILIQDHLKMVSLSVLDNPGLSIKEIAIFAQNRTLADEIVRKICLNRKWVRHYSIKLSLIQNPKTPPNMVLNYLKFMRKTDLKALSRNKDVPHFVMKMAKVRIQTIGGG